MDEKELDPNNPVDEKHQERKERELQAKKNIDLIARLFRCEGLVCP